MTCSKCGAPYIKNSVYQCKCLSGTGEELADSMNMEVENLKTQNDFLKSKLAVNEEKLEELRRDAIAMASRWLVVGMMGDIHYKKCSLCACTYVNETGQIVHSTNCLAMKYGGTR